MVEWFANSFSSELLVSFYIACQRLFLIMLALRIYMERNENFTFF